MKLLACLLLAVAATQAAEWYELTPVRRSKPGIRPVIPIDNERIIGGDFAVEGQFPYQIGMRMDDAYFCGGSLITDSIVLTAAHCVEGFSKWEVHAGALNFTDVSEDGRMVVTSMDGRPHENYVALFITNDIGLVFLPEAVSGPNIATVRLPSRSMEMDLFEGEMARVSGWGKPTDESETISEVLKFIDVRVINNTQCMAWYGELAINPSNICTSTNGGMEATCSGDSGGPLVWVEEDGEPTEIGIVSFGVSLGCANNFPSAYTRVTSFLDWIELNAGIVVRP